MAPRPLAGSFPRGVSRPGWCHHSRVSYVALDESNKHARGYSRCASPDIYRNGVACGTPHAAAKEPRCPFHTVERCTPGHVGMAQGRSFDPGPRRPTSPRPGERGWPCACLLPQTCTAESVRISGRAYALARRWQERARGQQPSPLPPQTTPPPFGSLQCREVPHVLTLFSQWDTVTLACGAGADPQGLERRGTAVACHMPPIPRLPLFPAPIAWHLAPRRSTGVRRSAYLTRCPYGRDTLSSMRT